MKLSAAALSFLVMLVGIVVLFGWFQHSIALTRIRSDLVSMKPATAFCFAMTGFSLFKTTRMGGYKLEAIVGASCALIVSGLFLADALGAPVRMSEAWAMWDSSLKSESPGEPSLATLACFLLASIGCLVVLTGRPAVAIGAVVAASGTSAVLGYALGIPLMYFLLPGTSTAMAWHTGACFLAWGAACILHSVQIKGTRGVRAS